MLGIILSTWAQTNDFPLHHRYLPVAWQPNIPTVTPGKMSLGKL